MNNVHPITKKEPDMFMYLAYCYQRNGDPSIDFPGISAKRLRPFFPVECEIKYDAEMRKQDES